MKVVYVSYPASENADVPASAEQALGLRDFLESRGHRLVATSDTGDGLDRELADAEVLITTPFWPVYLDEDRVKKAENLKLVITAGIGSDHTDPETAKQHGITVAEVTGSNVVSVAEHNVLQILALVRNFVPAHREAREGAGTSRRSPRRRTTSRARRSASSASARSAPGPRCVSRASTCGCCTTPTTAARPARRPRSACGTPGWTPWSPSPT